ncbi:hypothetical protein [Aquabacter cavernae]|nr:hypothetical protein [Aquabacter cavernae]
MEWVARCCVFLVYVPIGFAALLLSRRSLQKLGQGRDKPGHDGP